MDSARYIGRVGGLAVALGVGMAIAGAPGTAYAEPEGTESSAESSAASGSDASGSDAAGIGRPGHHGRGFGRTRFGLDPGDGHGSVGPRETSVSSSGGGRKRRHTAAPQAVQTA